MNRQILENLPLNIICKLVRAFDQRRAALYPKELPGLEEFILAADTGYVHVLDELEKEKMFDSISAYGLVLTESGQDISPYETFPTYFAYCNTNVGFSKFKEQQIAKGAEAVFGNAFCIFVAFGILSFFLSLAGLPKRYDDATIAKIVACSAKDDFFERLLDYVSDSESLNTVGDNDISMEILAYGDE